MSVPWPLQSRVFFVIPAHNEAPTVGRVAGDLRRLYPRARIIVVNDGSTDQTADQARRAGAQVVDLPFNCGYGVALQTGFLLAWREGADFTVTLDADGQHDPHEVGKLIAPIASGESDLCIGSRYLPGSRSYRVPRARRLGSLFFARLVSYLMQARITDPTTGFQCLNRKALGAFASVSDFPERTPDADMILLAAKSRCRVSEVAVIMHEDESGDSMHGFLKSFFYVPKMLVALLGVMLGISSNRVRPVWGARFR
jgi:glycosyltransferase involved in cell wall biosynthesis